MRVGERLRAAGLKATRPRVTVARTLHDMGGHRTADEVHEQLAGHGVALPRTSVYNALGALAEAGVVLHADVGPGAVVYEIADTWHHHFVCRRCGAIADVPCVVGERPCLSPGAGFGEVDEAQVIFRGVCVRCAQGGGAGE
ncbi:MAG TPA: Fur family transcriptional regulator [Pseudonocardiaceae bacterium]|jgi:Fur family ferric uptake transcriptional regulator